MSPTFIFVLAFGLVFLAMVGAIFWKGWFKGSGILLAVLLLAGGTLGFWHLHQRLEEQQRSLQTATRQLGEFRQNTASIQGLHNLQNSLNSDLGQLQETLKTMQERLGELNSLRQQLTSLEGRLLALENRVFLTVHPGAVIRKAETIVPGKSPLAKLLNIMAGWEISFEASGISLNAVVNDQTRFLDAAGKEVSGNLRTKFLQVNVSAAITVDNRGPALAAKVIQLMK